MERVTYVLGASFSAPLGLPVVGNFLTKSKDLFACRPAVFRSFQSIFDRVDELARVKNYFSADLFDVEEILSILEMRSGLEGDDQVDAFSNYICDVIKNYTPDFVPYKDGHLPGNWPPFLFGDNELHRDYGYFLSNLLRLEIEDNGESEAAAPHARFSGKVVAADAEYAVVTLNYDMVLEHLTFLLRLLFDMGTGLSVEPPDEDPDWSRGLALAKLHGTVETRKVIPPTWSKALHPEMQATWRYAYQLLSGSTQWRILGYSLAGGDSYVRYLLKSAAMDAARLKRIDVLCLDERGDVRRRYDDFVELPFYRFANIDFLEYLRALYDAHTVQRAGDRQRRVRFDRLETTHDEFFTAAVRRAV